jgi:glycosyltransferase involved in cell wall biosynthesis
MSNNMHVDKDTEENRRPRVSVVIPCRNERQHILRCVGALLHGTMPAFEAIVVDGMSTDGTRQLVQSLTEEDPRVRLIDNPNRTTPSALNYGIAHARGEFIAILGGHSEPSPSWLARNLSALERNPNAVGVGGVLETIGSSRMGRIGAAVLQSRFGVGNARFRVGGSPGLVDTIVFGCYRRSAFQYGLFATELTTNQDDEFNIRLRACGEQLFFDPSINCRYYSRSTWRGLVRQYWRYGRFKPMVFRRAGAIGSLRQLVPAAWVAFLVFALCLGPVFTIFGYTNVAVCAVYLSMGICSAIGLVGVNARDRLLFVPVAASVHLAYGLGMWYGVFADVFCRGTVSRN